MRIHLIGICGTGMGSVAGLLQAAGHEVRGSDEHVYAPMSTQLERLGITLYEGFGPENLDWGPEVVVVGNVCRRDHVEVLAAQARGIRLASFPGIMEEMLLPGRRTLVVAGTHGKTTTSALAAFVLERAARAPSYLIGGVPLRMERSARLGGEPFVIEGDEYDTAFFDKKSKFLHYRPHVAIVTSLELDHVDIFSDAAAMEDSFREFVALIPPEGLLLLCNSDARTGILAEHARCRVERYGVRDGKGGAALAWEAQVEAARPGGRTVFAVRKNGELFGRFETGLPGLYNLENVLAVIAATHAFGLTAAEIEPGVRGFVGVRRRQEVRGMAQGVTVIDDFAHHPTAVRKTLEGLRGRHGRGRLWAVFEPRSATSRTAVFQREFAEALAVADEVLIAPVHMPHKAPEGNRLSTEQLAADVRGLGIPAKVFEGTEPLVEHLVERASAGDTVVVMSSGSFDGIHERILLRLGDAVVTGKAADLPGVWALLEQVKLPIEGVGEDLDLLVLKDGSGELVGCVALELRGDNALLRSLAVRPDRRGEGLGWMLAEQAVGRARWLGMRRIYLLTEHATDFFAEKFGFRPLALEEMPAEVQASSEYCTGRCRGAVAMMIELG